MEEERHYSSDEIKKIVESVQKTSPISKSALFDYLSVRFGVPRECYKGLMMEADIIRITYRNQNKIKSGESELEAKLNGNSGEK